MWGFGLSLTRTRINNIILGIIYLCHTLVKHLRAILTKFFIFRVWFWFWKVANFSQFWAGMRDKNGLRGRAGWWRRPAPPDCGGGVRAGRSRAAEPCGRERAWAEMRG